MRRSVEYQPANAYIISVQLNQQSWDKLQQICKQTGFSKSKMIKMLVMGARVQQSSKIQENPTTSHP